MFKTLQSAFRIKRKQTKNLNSRSTLVDALESRVLLAGQIYIPGGSTGTDTTGIGVYDSSTGAVINGDLVGSLPYPSGVLVSGTNLYEINRGASAQFAVGSIGLYTTAGATVNASLVTDIYNPTGIVSAGGNLFVTGTYGSPTGGLTNGYLGEYTTSGTAINATLANFIENPTGIAAVGSNVFVLDSYANRVNEYSAAGAASGAPLIALPETENAQSIAASGSDIFLMSEYSGTVYEYTTAGKLVTNSLITGLSTPLEMAVFGSDLYIVSLTADHNFIVGEYTTSGATVNADLITTLNDPTGLTVTGTVTVGANQLAFAQPPAAAATSATIAPVIVDVEDSTGSLITSDNSNVTITLAGGTSGAVLAGTTTVAAVNGVATFSDLSISTAGSYSLTASDGSDTPITSDSFQISDSGTGGTASPVAPTITKTTLPTTAVSGITINSKLAVKLTNTSTTATESIAANHVAVYASATGVVDSNSTLIPEKSAKQTLKPGKVANLSFSIKSLTLPAASYSIIVQTTDSAGLVSDVVASTVNVVTPFVSLSATASATKQTLIKAGQSVSLTLTFANAGNIDAKGKMIIAIGLSADGQTLSIPLKPQTKSPTIKAGGKLLTQKLTFSIPKGTVAGSYFPYFTITQGTTDLTVIGAAQFTVS